MLLRSHLPWRDAACVLLLLALALALLSRLALSCSFLPASMRSEEGKVRQPIVLLGLDRRCEYLSARSPLLPRHSHRLCATPISDPDFEFRPQSHQISSLHHQLPYLVIPHSLQSTDIVR